MEQLKACYENYLAEADEVLKNRTPWDGVFGIGSPSKNHPCHIRFFRAVEAWVENFVNNEPNQQLAEEAVTYILEGAEPYRDKFPYWTLFAAHGLARPLIPYVSPEYAEKTLAWYKEHCPRRERLPVHKDLFKLLKKQARV